MTPRVHCFESTGEAYDDSQTGYFPADWRGSEGRSMDEWEEDMIEVADGDVLVVASERAVAVMVEAWPVAISPEHAGENFHVGNDTLDWTRVQRVGSGNEYKDYSVSVALARAEVAKLAEVA